MFIVFHLGMLLFSIPASEFALFDLTIFTIGPYIMYMIKDI